MNILEQFLQGSNGQIDASLIKALTAGDQTGMQYVNQTAAGVGSIKVQSIDNAVRVLGARMENLRLYNMIPKKNVFSNIHEYKQLVKYGEAIDPFMIEGDNPIESDSQYRACAAYVKYMGVGGKLTDQAAIVGRVDGADQVSEEAKNKTMLLLQRIAAYLTEGNSSTVSKQFDGLWKQHYDGINALYTAPTLDNYFGDVCVIDARGRALDDAMVQEAASGVTNDRFGQATKIFASPVVFQDYGTRYRDLKRFNVGQDGAITNVKTGLRVNSIQTQFGNPLELEYDVFMDKKVAKTQTAAKGPHANTPANPTPDGSPAVVKTNTSTKFTDSAGSYIYGVTSKNQYGESAMVKLTASPLAVSATQAVTLKFAQTNNSYPATGFVIYRSEKDDIGANAKLHPIFEVTAAQHATGYDGGGATEVVDRNLFIANTHSAMVLDPTPNMWHYLELGGTRRFDFQNDMNRRFSIVNYGTPVLYAPGRVARIINIGRDIS